MKRLALAYRSKSHGSRGMVLVFYALALMVMMGFVAMVVDIGYLYTQKAQKQFLADLTALTVLGTAGAASRPKRRFRRRRSSSSPAYDAGSFMSTSWKTTR